jgi:haloalkane dehalogenase
MTAADIAQTAPAWLDRAEYPFAPHFLPVDGGRMHYVDEGSGSPVLLVHGTPVWSFLYRGVIKRLSPSHRVIAPDHIGFGLSDKPKDWPYTFAAHSANMSRLIRELDLHDATAVVHDLGGPVRLSAVLDQPERFRRVVIMNTVFWRLTDSHFTRPARLFGGRFGRLLYTRFNISARYFIPRVFGSHKLSPAAHAQYWKALPKGQRMGPWVFAREMRTGGDWLEQQSKRADALRRMPVLIIWGEKDPAFRVKELEQWTALLPEAKVVRLPDVGHFIAEEVPERVASEVEGFVRGT